MDQPKIKEVTVHFGGGGKVQIQQYVQGSEYGCNISRTYEVPGDWTEEQISLFELETFQAIKDEIEPILQEEHNDRMRAREAIEG